MKHINYEKLLMYRQSDENVRKDVEELFEQSQHPRDATYGIQWKVEQSLSDGSDVLDDMEIIQERWDLYRFKISEE